MLFKDFYTDELVLTEEGKKFLQPLQDSLINIFHTKEVKNMSESEVQILSDSIANIVREHISNQRQISKVTNQDIQLMSDEEFESYLQHKYDNFCFLNSLTTEEFNRAMLIYL